MFDFQLYYFCIFLFDVVQKVINYIEMTEQEKINVEEIQNLVEKALRDSGHKNISQAYSSYRRESTKVRDIKSDLMKEFLP